MNVISAVTITRACFFLIAPLTHLNRAITNNTLQKYAAVTFLGEARIISDRQRREVEHGDVLLLVVIQRVLELWQTSLHRAVGDVTRQLVEFHLIAIVT